MQDSTNKTATKRIVEEKDMSADSSTNKKKARDCREYESMLLDLVRDEIKGL